MLRKKHNRDFVRQNKSTSLVTANMYSLLADDCLNEIMLNNKKRDFDSFHLNNDLVTTAKKPLPTAQGCSTFPTLRWDLYQQQELPTNSIY